MPLLDHIEFATTNLEEMRAFYTRALAPLGAGVHVEGPPVGFGDAQGLPFWLKRGEKPQPAIHFAFGCATRAVVHDAFEAAVAGGGSEPRAPKLLAHIAPDYFAAFIRDPDGHLVEFVCRAA